MTWFRKKQSADVPSWGSLRVVKAWSGHYVIEQYHGRFFISSKPVVRWWLVEDAGEFDTAEAALERIKFMGKLDKLVTGEAA